MAGTSMKEAKDGKGKSQMAVEMQRQVSEACPSREIIALECYHEEAHLVGHQK